jgi:hypothetical protein
MGFFDFVTNPINDAFHAVVDSNPISKGLSDAVHTVGENTGINDVVDKAAPYVAAAAAIYLTGGALAPEAMAALEGAAATEGLTAAEYAALVADSAPIDSAMAGAGAADALPSYLVDAGRGMLTNAGMSALTGREITPQGLLLSGLTSGIGGLASSFVGDGLSSALSSAGISSLPPEVLKGLSTAAVQTGSGLAQGKDFSTALAGGVTSGIGSGVGNYVTNEADLNGVGTSVADRIAGNAVGAATTAALKGGNVGNSAKNALSGSILSALINSGTSSIGDAIKQNSLEEVLKKLPTATENVSTADAATTRSDSSPSPDAEAVKNNSPWEKTSQDAANVNQLIEALYPTYNQQGKSTDPNQLVSEQAGDFPEDIIHNEDGTTTILEQDGTKRLIDLNGNIILLDANGNPVKDPTKETAKKEQSGLNLAQLASSLIGSSMSFNTPKVAAGLPALAGAAYGMASQPNTQQQNQAPNPYTFDWNQQQIQGPIDGVAYGQQYFNPEFKHAEGGLLSLQPPSYMQPPQPDMQVGNPPPPAGSQPQQAYGQPNPYVEQKPQYVQPTINGDNSLSLNNDPSTAVNMYAAGGMPIAMNHGGISTLGGYSDGGRMLKGPGDGMSDDIPASIAGKQPARLATEEFVIPADVVSHLGNGSSEAGAKVLYKMMEQVRKARTGNPKQGKRINPHQFMPKGGR